MRHTVFVTQTKLPGTSTHICCAISHKASNCDMSAAFTVAKFSKVLASIKWYLTARYASVLIEVHISDVKLTANAFDTIALAFSLDVCTHMHLPCGENIGVVESFNKLSEPFVLNNSEGPGILNHHIDQGLMHIILLS